ncbi:MAG TPA: replication-associated recombination protein A [Victivallales bacterium]|nr:replication-associated recombination protein A [Victivallales bacterium]
METLLFDLEPPNKDLSLNDTNSNDSKPLAAKLRPRTFEDYIGQKHILANDKLLKKAIESDTFSSIILHGPPGVGKTSLAELIALKTNSNFVRLSGVVSKVADLRKEIKTAQQIRELTGKKTIIFIDEIHRFNRAQQDSLLPDIESGNIRFIGATTHNPHFFVISPLLSRSLVFGLNSLNTDEIIDLLYKSINDNRAFNGLSIELNQDAAEFWAEICEGDARRALNALEIAVSTSGIKLNPENKFVIDIKTAKDAVQSKSINYGDDEHFDIISAFIKSMRGSDPDAAVYWLARMLKSGEDIMYIARRIVIFSSEDIGNADPRAIQIATSVMQAVEMIGMPEAKILLSQATTYCATAPKSNSSYLAIKDAFSDVEKKRIEPVPVYLKSNYCKSSGEVLEAQYKYPHDHKEHHVEQDYLGVKKSFYKPGDLGYERKIKERMNYWKSLNKI